MIVFLICDTCVYISNSINNRCGEKKKETSATGASMAVRTIIMRTRAAEGTEAMEALVASDWTDRREDLGWRYQDKRSNPPGQLFLEQYSLN